MRPASRATGREGPPKQSPNDEEAGSQVFHALQPRTEGFQVATTGQDSGVWTFVHIIG